jgi:hypothetical protein
MQMVWVAVRLAPRKSFVLMYRMVLMYMYMYCNVGCWQCTLGSAYMHARNM